MRNKHDMYIDYERFNKKRGKRGSKKFGFFICFILLAAGMGITVFYIMRPDTTDTKPDTSNMESDTDQSEQDAVNNNTDRITPIDQIAGVSPTVLPTSQPVKAVTNPEVHNDDSGASPDASTIVKGIYVPANTAGSDRMNELIDMADSTEINAMVIDVKNDNGKISYAMDCDLAKEIGADTDTISDIQGLVQKLKEKNIYLIARIVAFKDPFLAEKRPDMAIKNKDGTLYLDSNKEAWVNPYNRNVWDYLIDIASQSAAAGFDEIQFDYIRFSTSKAIAQADFGKDAAGISKEAIITEFTRYAYEKLKPLGVNISADVYGTIIASSVDAGLVGQNFVEMSKYLDYICPMIYPSHFSEGNLGIKYPDTEPYQIINKILSISAEKLSELPADEHHAIVRPWLQDFTATWVKHHISYGADEIREQIEGVYSVGYDEWLLWNAGSKYTEDGLMEE